MRVTRVPSQRATTETRSHSARADNSGGFQSPAPDHVLIFEEGGVLTVFRLSVNGNVVLSRAEAGQANNVGH